MIRDDIKAAQLAAMKAGDKPARNAISLIQAAIKNRDIEARTGQAPADDDALVVEVLQKMVKLRRESIAMYEQGNRPELAEAEAAEVAVIERFLPAQIDEAETRAAIEATAARMEGQFWLNSKAEDAKKLAILQEHGIEITQPSPELRAALLEKAKPLWDDFKARVPDAAPYVDAYLTARQ